MWVARVADLASDKNQTVRTAAIAVLHRVYAGVDPECLIRHVAAAPRQEQHQLLQALLSTLPDLPQQVSSPAFWLMSCMHKHAGTSHVFMQAIGLEIVSLHRPDAAIVHGS